MIRNLNPQAVWKNFYLLTQVPRPSGHLENVQNFLLQWAKERGIEAWKDGGENIIMRKPATPGMENRPTATMQAHMDMVPQKTDESQHNFETDPIETYIDGDWVKAKGTTLGSDDGMGVAAIMGVFESKDLKHGPLEALITADEETCMYGVNHLAADTLKGEILLNIDHETLGEFVIGSAGGVNINCKLGYKEVKPEEGDIAGIALRVIGADEAKQGTLAAAVRTLQRPMLSLADGEIEVLEYGALSIANVDVMGFQHFKA